MRCVWCLGDEQYIHYHDFEWGVPVHDEVKLFEFLILEGAQAGLSWLTVLRKREHYRKVFDQFKPEIIASYDSTKVTSLMNDAGIIRNRLKIASTIKNAQGFLAIQEQKGSFEAYLWDFVGGKPIQNNFKTIKDLPSDSEISRQISKDLKRRGFSFVGSTIIYAFMQAVGMVNDHYCSCNRHRELGGTI